VQVARLGLLFVSLGIGIVMALGGTASALTYTVTTPYRVDHTLAADASWNAYELTAQNDQRVTYSMTITTSGACAMMFFIKGHGVTPESKYFIAYSQENCAQSYANTFPVGSRDGTDFTVLILTDYTGDVNYTLAIDIASPVVPSWLTGIGVLAVIVVVGVLIRTVRRRRRAARMASMPPLVPGFPPVMPPPAPPMQPPQPPSG